MRMRRRFGRYAHAHTIWPLCACADELAAMRMDDFAAMRMRRRFSRCTQAQTIWPLCACADDLAAMRRRRLFGHSAHAQTIWPLCAYDWATTRMRRWFGRYAHAQRDGPDCPGISVQGPRGEALVGAVEEGEQLLPKNRNCLPLCKVKHRQQVIGFYNKKDHGWGKSWDPDQVEPQLTGLLDPYYFFISKFQENFRKKFIILK